MAFAGLRRRLAPAFLVSALATSPGLAVEFGLDGVWQADNNESRYTMESCGDGTQLCATLVWIKPDKIDDKNRPYINTKVVDGARLVQISPLIWRGTIHVYGHSVFGSVTQVNADRFQVKGCAFIIFCLDMGINRVSAVAAK